MPGSDIHGIGTAKLEYSGHHRAHEIDVMEGGSSTNGSRRSSATGGGGGGAATGTGKRFLGAAAVAAASVSGPSLMPGGGVRKGSFVDPKSLPIITEKSDTQSVITEASSKR